MNISEVHSIANGQPLIYLLDTAHSFEEDLLKEWLQKERPLGALNAQPFTVPILRSGNSGRLRHALSAPEDTLITPLRVVWQPPGVAKEAPRFRDLLLGDRRSPGKMRARRIRRNHPERVAYVVGQPATIVQLHQRFDQTAAGKARNEPDGFVNFVERQAGLVLDIAERGLQGSRYKVPRFVAEYLQACRPRSGPSSTCWWMPSCRFPLGNGRRLKDVSGEGKPLQAGLASSSATAAAFNSPRISRRTFGSSILK